MMLYGASKSTEGAIFLLYRFTTSNLITLEIKPNDDSCLQPDLKLCFALRARVRLAAITNRLELETGVDGKCKHAS